MDGDALEAELECQAQVMAEKALAALPEGVRASKIGKVKEGILKRLKDQAQAAGGGATATPASVPAVAQGVPAAAATVASAPPPPTTASASAPPPPPPPTGGEDCVKTVKLEGVEACGDEPWFADLEVRQLLRASVANAHAENKILVGVPAMEIARICPGGGRVLGAGAVLRLGGSLLGGYGEADIGYAYRQLSRALHPDKNPDIAEAHDAFKRLSEAADELRQGLNEARATLSILCQVMGAGTTPEMLERPQEALFAEAMRVLSAVLALSGEGEVPQAAMSRGMAAFTASPSYPTCQAQLLLAEWWDGMQVLDHFSGMPLRTAYDCAPKRFRAQFICLLNRAVLAEARRNQDCVRGNWQAIMMQFPEINLWRALREKLRLRVWTPDPVPDGQAAVEEDRDSKRRSKWDEKTEQQKTSSWARKWRKKIKMVLPRGLDEAISVTDPEVMLLATAIWKDVTEWARTDLATAQHLELFTSEPTGRVYVARGIDMGDQPSQWAFVPAMDILLIVGEGIVGFTAEGIFADNVIGHEKMPFAEAMVSEHARVRRDGSKEGRSRSRARRRSRDREGKDRKPQNDPDFDWEKVWRSRVNNRRRPARSLSPRCRSRSRRRRARLRSASRGRSPSQRRRSRSRRRTARSASRRKKRERATE
eukprot:TRINITY_DN41858_c0_g1_i1.p1 TRINITY_DN41858_c0_g1~~TRINITY_DN41858_c0_g1_i1.p1  ORF type:complete len:651 (+),score=136.23 TRINITY_DN41858_c0_g1_i1:215-2167(+)